MAKPIWKQASKHFKINAKTDVKDCIDVEVGDSKDSSIIHPQMKMSRWDNEANVSFRLIHDFLPGGITYSEQNGVISWKKGQWEAKFYEDWMTDEGAYKFCELYIPKKPPINQFSFSVVSKDVNFFYQPALTPEEIAHGAEGPEEAMGSYSIYSNSSGIMNEASGKDYKVGKIGHLYRAKLIDANGDEIWADYNTDLNETKILTIKVDQKWLDNALYPVVLDPTFGYTSVGSFSIFASDRPWGSAATLSEGGEITKLTAYWKRTNITNIPSSAAIYDNASTHNLQTNGAAGNTNITSSTGEWLDYTFTTNPVLTADTYALVSNSDYDNNSSRACYFFYDSTGDTFYKASLDFDSGWPSTLTESSGFNRIHSIYATYTITGSVSPSISPSISPSVSPSTSISPSLSPSISPSVSPSASISPSLSPSISPSVSPSTSISPSLSPSISPSISPSPSPGYQEYTRGDEVTLPTNDSNLETTYSTQDYTDVSIKNDVRVDQTASSQYSIHQFKDFAGSNVSVSLEWEGQTTLAPSTSTVYLQVYNQNTSAWEAVDSDSTTAINTDFVLSGSVSDLTNYKDGGNLLSCRVYQNAI